MKFRYPTDKEFEMVEKLYFFENTKFYGISTLNRYMLSDAKAYPEWIKKNACDAFVTEDGQGFCGLTPNIDGSKYVHAIWVNESYRGKGCGKALIEHAKTLSPKGLTLHVNIQNPKALCLYNKCGFKVAAMEGPDEDHNLFWRIYMETKDGLKGRECDTIKYEFPTKEMREGRMGQTK